MKKIKKVSQMNWLAKLWLYQPWARVDPSTQVNLQHFDKVNNCSTYHLTDVFIADLKHVLVC